MFLSATYDTEHAALLSHSPMSLTRLHELLKRSENYDNFPNIERHVIQDNHISSAINIPSFLQPKLNF